MSSLSDKNKYVYVVTMYRYGNIEAHSYVLGVYSTKEDAWFTARIEEAWRGGKYEATVKTIILDAPTPEEQIEWHNKCK